MPLHPRIAEITARIEARSQDLRDDYLARMRAARKDGPSRAAMSCSNLAHVMAAAGDDKGELKALGWPNVGIVTAYNDMLSAHQPFEKYPDIIRAAARSAGATAQVAGGVPAMCDGVTQGQEGMELSLFSRDVIAMATGVALSHDAFDAVLLLGVCDKIVPGMFLGAAAFGHLPILFVPAGPMPSGIPNPEKAKVRQKFAAGEVSRAELLEVESQSYHAPGTCTFYGTANTNQMTNEMMGLHVPGTAFVPPGTELRKALTEAATRRAAKTTHLGKEYIPFAEVIDARSIVNAIAGLMATGGSTNLVLHLTAMARSVGVRITLEDFADISAVTPLLARVYPNGVADTNHFHAAGGMAFIISQLMKEGLVHEDVMTVWGRGLSHYAKDPFLKDGELVWKPADEVSGDADILRAIDNPFTADGGLRHLKGNLGDGVSKVSAVDPAHRVVEAPAVIFENQADVAEAYNDGRLDRDCVVVVRFQGAAANGMPELHKLTPPLANLQGKGFKVALVTDGRMSGASGKVLSAIHMSPGAERGGPLAKLRDGDVIRVDAERGDVTAQLTENELMSREVARPNLGANHYGVGRDLFGLFRNHVSTAELGASVLFGE